MKKFLLLMLLISLFITPLFMQKSVSDESIGTTNRSEKICQLLVNVNGTELLLEDYLIGVLAGEMPASFHEEALKAQAIAARTYVLKQTNNGQNTISATTAHQVFLNEQLREEKWQTAFAQNEQKLAKAVEQTKHQVLTYNNELITAMFHASSYQQTESAKNYSNHTIPYLQSVASLEPLEAKQVTYTYSDLNERLERNFQASDYKQAKLTKNSSGRVESVMIAGETWSGREMREHLALRATNFTWQPNATGVLVKTLGYGHGVGMSQEGANTMAESGATAQQILEHYYPNTMLQTFDYCEK